MTSNNIHKTLIDKLELYSEWERRLLYLRNIPSNTHSISKCLNLLRDIKHTHVNYYLQIDTFNNELESLLLTSPDLVWDIY